MPVYRKPHSDHTNKSYWDKDITNIPTFIRRFECHNLFFDHLGIKLVKKLFASVLSPICVAGKSDVALNYYKSAEKEKSFN